MQGRHSLFLGFFDCTGGFGDSSFRREDVDKVVIYAGFEIKFTGCIGVVRQ
jgi:hypothetical protein